MSVKKEPNGRRSIQVETEVAGTPEQVWQAIATGPGVTAWFVPTEIESDASGKPVKVISHFGPGMDGVAEVKAWEPPHRFVDEQRRGPYRRWHHEHTFRAVAGGTEVRDRVDYELRAVAAVGARVVARDVRAIFAYRQRTLAERFGEG